mgnify:CR=1 FL=1
MCKETFHKRDEVARSPWNLSSTSQWKMTKKRIMSYGMRGLPLMSLSIVCVIVYVKKANGATAVGHNSSRNAINVVANCS